MPATKHTEPMIQPMYKGEPMGKPMPTDQYVAARFDLVWENDKLKRLVRRMLRQLEDCRGALNATGSYSPAKLDFIIRKAGKELSQ